MMRNQTCRVAWTGRRQRLKLNARGSEEKRELVAEREKKKSPSVFFPPFPRNLFPFSLQVRMVPNKKVVQNPCSR